MNFRRGPAGLASWPSPATLTGIGGAVGVPLMTGLSIFSDEAGCLGFRGHPRESRYFILCSVLTDDGDGLTLALSHMRRALLRKIADVPDYFHATNDRQIVRDHVYDLLARHDFRVRATIIRKSDVQDDLRQPPIRFLQFAWHAHFSSALVGAELNEDTLFCAASIGTRKEKAAFKDALGRALRHAQPLSRPLVDFRQSGMDPCLQVADYCAWAIQRKWESDGRDVRSYQLIADRMDCEVQQWDLETII